MLTCLDSTLATTAETVVGLVLGRFLEGNCVFAFYFPMLCPWLSASKSANTSSLWSPASCAAAMCQPGWTHSRSDRWCRPALFVVSSGGTFRPKCSSASHAGWYRGRRRADQVFDPDAHMPRINRRMVYLDPCSGSAGLVNRFDQSS